MTYYAVIDTNVFISALYFMRLQWKNVKMTPTW